MTVENNIMKEQSVYTIITITTIQLGIILGIDSVDIDLVLCSE